LVTVLPTEAADDVLNNSENVLFLCDYLFSFERTEPGDASDEILVRSTDCFKAMMLKWREMGISTVKMPKIHAIEDLLLWQMALYLGMRDFVKDFIKPAY
jgi:hypothetical protein